MYRLIVLCSIFLTLIVATCSKSVRSEDDEGIEGTNDTRDDSTTPDLPLLHDQLETDPKINAKRSLLILMPVSEEEEELECKEIEGNSQKIKRCRTPVHRGLVSSSLPKDRNILKSRNTENLPHNSDIMRRIQERLKPREQIVGAVHKSPIPNTDVFEDDEYVCHCRRKNNPLPSKGTDKSVLSRPSSSTRRTKPEIKQVDDRTILGGRKHHDPIHATVPHHPTQLILPKPPTLHTGVPHRSHHLFHKNAHPVLQHKGRERIPYIPYVHRVDPKAKPTRIHIPVHRAPARPDSFVGQRAPTIEGENNLNESRQTVEQSTCSSNMVGATASQASSKKEQDSFNAFDYNLQSVHLRPSKYTTENVNNDGKLHTSGTPLEPKGSNAQTYDSETNAKSSTGFEQPREYETTANERALNYSEIKEVTNSYFTSIAYTDEIERGPTSFDDFPVTENESANTDPSKEGNYNVDSQNPSNILKENSMERKNIETSTEEEKIVVVGESDPNWNQKESTSDDLNENVEYNKEGQENVDNYGGVNASPMEEATPLIPKDSRLDETGVLEKIADKDVPGEEVNFAETDGTEPKAEDNSDSSNNDHKSGTFESDNTNGRIEDEEADEGVEDSLRNDYTTIVENLINTEKEETRPRDENENGSLVGLSLKSSGNDDTEETKVSSDRVPAFCDNSLLHKSIKSVINGFATGNDETVGSARDNELLPEIVGIPNLKSILSMPPVQKTITDKVKDRLSQVVTIDKTTFDNDKFTSLIRNALRHMLAAAPTPKTELPPMTVEEHQFKNGKWVTNLVTLGPMSNEKTPASMNLEKVQASVKSLLRDPAVGLQAAKHPAVQNMIVQSVRNSFKPKNRGRNDEAVDDSVVRSSLNEELRLMETENEEIATTEEATESNTLDMSNIDVSKLLDIAKSQAGIDDARENESSTVESLTVSNFEKNSPNSDVNEDNSDSSNVKNIEEDTEKEPVDYDVGATRSNELSKIPRTEKEIKMQESTTLSMKEFSRIPKYKSGSKESLPNVGAAASRNQNEPSTVDAEDNTSKERIESTGMVGMKNTGSDTDYFKKKDTSPERDFAYLGKISVKTRNNTDEVQSLQNSELFYIGDGVKLPLEIRKLNDGSYALSISRKVCEHLLNKECPCCVPVKGNVVHAVRGNLETRHHDTTIETNRGRRRSKGESTKSILPNQRRKRDSSDDSLQIFSMPVETFVRRYNLSLNLENVKTPWNFDREWKIDEQRRDRPKNFQNKETNSADVDLLRNLLAVHATSGNEAIVEKERMNNNARENGDATSYEYQVEKQNQRYLDRYRYQRNINENVNKRMEIIKSVLHWLRDTILSLTTER